MRRTLIAPKQKSADDGRMENRAGLSKCKLVAFVTVVDVDRAKAFYRETLGLRLVSEELPFALVFDANGTTLRVAIAKQVLPSHGTVLGWQVSNMAEAVRDLVGAGVRFEQYEFMKQDEMGIWTSPSGARVAWFKDPDGNVLSITEHPGG